MAGSLPPGHKGSVPDIGGLNGGGEVWGSVENFVILQGIFPWGVGWGERFSNVIYE